jgi:signal recognition particle receptor subunit beta
MALVNEVKREINAKIVFVGPTGTGKSTSLQYIYKKLKPEFRSQLKKMPMQDGQMLFFDFMPPGQGGAGGYNVRFHIYTLAGEPSSAAAWKMLLKGTDGIIFVADAAPGRVGDNQASLALTQEYLAQCKQGLDTVPWLILGNKQDIDGAMSLVAIQDSLNAGNVLTLPAVANKGEGVLEALYQLIKVILRNLRENGFAAESASDELPESKAPSARAASGPCPSVVEEDVAPVIQHGESGTDDDSPEITLSVAGEPAILANGRVSIPVLVRCGEVVKKVDLALSLTIS